MMAFLARLFLSVTLGPLLGAYSGYRAGICADTALRLSVPGMPFYGAAGGALLGLWLAVLLVRCARACVPASVRFLDGLVVVTLGALGLGDLMAFLGAGGWWATAAVRYTPFAWVGCLFLAWVASRGSRRAREEEGEDEALLESGPLSDEEDEEGEDTR